MRTVPRAAFLLALTAALATAGSAAAQDAIGVTFAGQVLRLDSTTGAATVLASGAPGKNCLTFDNDNRLWTTVRPNPTQNVWRLARIDPITGAETLPFPTVNVGDLRAMCIGRLAGGIYAIRDAAPNDELVHIDTDTGALTVIGATNHAAIQGLEDPFGGAKAWDVNAGMLLIDLDTAHTNDPHLGVASPAGMQFLCRHPVTNERYVGRGSLFSLDTGSSVTTLVTNFAGNPDLRGMEFTTNRDERFGQACPASSGLFLDMPSASAPGTMTVRSTNHAPNVLGGQIVGFSEDSFNGLPLPLDLDPLLGTAGCELWVSADLLLAGVADASGALTVQLALPAAAAMQQFYVQHFALANVPGGFAFTGGLRVRAGL